MAHSKPRTLFVLVGLFLLWPLIASAQSLFSSGFNYEDELLSGFSEDGRIKVLLLTLSPSGMTETAAEQISRSLQLSLFNTNHFTVVGPQEWNAQLMARDPSLADCHDISCGILIGKLFNADKVLVGRISTERIFNEMGDEVDGFLLSVRLLDVTTNATDFRDEIQFTDQTMQDELFQLTVRISENTLLRGKVLTAENRDLVIDLGRAHGLKEGHRVVVYQQAGTTTNLDGETVGLEQKNIAIAEVIRLNDFSSDVFVSHRTSLIGSGDMVKTFINPAKRVELVTNARRELDIQRRLNPPKRRDPLSVEPTVVRGDTGREKWQNELAEARSAQQRWMYIALGSGAATLFLLNTEVEFISGVDDFLPIITGAVAGYAGYQYFVQRELIDDLQAEGKVRGFTKNDWDLRVIPTRSGMQLAFDMKF